MLNEQTHTEPNWKLLPGTILDGGYEMQELLDADARRARFKIRVLGDRTIDAFASFFPIGETAAQDQIEAWDLLRRIPHPNVGKLYAAGRRELDGTEVIYVVLRKPDETLDGALRERPLAPEEAAEVLLAGARALEHLDRHGLGYTAVSPEQVQAFGDSIQLSPEGVRKTDAAALPSPLKARYAPPEGPSAGANTAAAVWSLGATVFETLTQTAWSEERREQLKKLPLGWVLERCLDPEAGKRCKPEEIPGLVKSGPPAVVVLAPTSETAAAAETRDADAVKASGGTVAAVAAGASSSGVAVPASAQPKPLTPDVQPPRPPATSASQARTKAFQQAEFDTLTAPKSTGVGAKSVASAALEASLASTASGAAQAGASAVRPSLTVGKHGSSLTGSSPSGISSLGAEAESGRRSARGTFNVELEPQSSRTWIYVVAGILIVLFLIWTLRPKPGKAVNHGSAAITSAQNAGSPAAKTTASPTDTKAWPTRTLEPDKSASATTNPTASPVPAKPDVGTLNGPVWRVIVYTFNREADAEKKVKSLNAKHPHLEAQVFTPTANSGPYLVTVGGKMTRENAARFRSKAVSMGLPHDSYIQNYKP